MDEMAVDMEQRLSVRPVGDTVRRPYLLEDRPGGRLWTALIEDSADRDAATTRGTPFIERPRDGLKWSFGMRPSRFAMEEIGRVGVWEMRFDLLSLRPFVAVCEARGRMFVCSDTDHCEDRRDEGHVGTGGWPQGGAS
jgi:hypothetical protein